MKSIFFSLIVILAFGTISSAHAKTSIEPLGQSGCDGLSITDYYTDLKYFVNQNQVRILVEMKDSDDGIPNETSFETSAIASLKVDGKVIIHQPTGRVCARFVNATVFGKRQIWEERGDCKVITKETRLRTTAGKTCVRDYSLEISY